MLRRNQIITIAALAACALPASQALALPAEVTAPVVSDQATERAPKAGTQGYRSADGLDAAKGRGIYATDATPRQYGSPDSLDANQHRGLYALDRDRVPQPVERAYGSPDALDAAEHRGLFAADGGSQTVQVRELPSSDFDWGDAGIGAAFMVALLSIAGGSTLLLTWRRRRRFQMVAH